MVAAGTLIAEILRRELTPRERLPVDEWADRWVKVPGKVGAEAGAWGTDRTPYLRRAMRLFADHRVRMITFMSGTQLGKTSLVDILKMWMVCERPVPAVVMYPTEDAARDYNQDRFIPTLLLCEPAAAHLQASPQDVKSLKITFDNCILRFVGANAEMGRRMWPCGAVFNDEIGAYKEPRWVTVFDRVKTFERSCIVNTSSPDDEHTDNRLDTIDALYRAGSRERFWVPCIHCGWYQVLSFRQVRWDGGGSSKEALATARYECVRGGAGCGGKIYDHHKPGMLRRGVWIAEKESKGAKALEAAEAAELDAGAVGKPPPEHASFQLSSLYSPFAAAGFGRLAQAWVMAGGQATREFVNSWLGEPWSAPSDRVREDELRRLTVGSGYRLKEVPAGAIGLLMTVDVQKRELYVEVRAWGAWGRDTWLIAAYVVPRAEGRNLVELDDLRAVGGVPRVYRRQGSDRTVRVAATAIDSGHFTAEVYEAVRRMKARGERVYAVKGAGFGGSGAMARPWMLTKIETWPESAGPKFSGKLIAGGVELLVVNEDQWATAVTGRLRGLPGFEEDGGAGEEDGRPPREDGVLPGFYLPEDPGGELEPYIVQVCSMERVLKVDAKGRINPRRGAEYEWRLQKGRSDNHFFDTTKYNFALADMLGVRRLSGDVAAAPRAAGKSETPGKWAQGAGAKTSNWKDV